MQRTSNFIVLLESWAATQDLWKPELANGTLHVGDLPLRGRRRFHPLRRLSANTTHHICVGQSLGSSLARLDIQCGGKRLCDPRVQRGGPTRNDQVVNLIPCGRSLAGARSKTERRCHNELRAPSLSSSWIVSGEGPTAAMAAKSDSPHAEYILFELGRVSFCCSTTRRTGQFHRGVTDP